MEVILVPRPLLPVAVADVWVGVGSANETPANNGLTRLLERMLFTSTGERPAGMIDEQLNEMGGSRAARADVDWTHYAVIVPSESITAAIGILADVTQNSDFPSNQSAAAKRDLQAERDRRAADPIGLLAETTRSLFYGDHPYALLDVGADAALEAQTPDDIRAFRDRYFVPNNMAVVIVGDIDVESTLAVVEQAFGALKPGEVPASQAPEISRRTEPEVVEIAVDGDLGYMNFAWPAPSVRQAADAQAFDVLVELLAGSQNARLLKTLQQDLGAVARGNASFAKMRHTGIFEISAIFPHQNRPLVERAIQSELQRILDGDLEESEVARAKTILLAKRARRLETGEAFAGELGFSAMTGDDYRLALAAPAGLRTVTAGDVISVARNYLDPHAYLEVVLVPRDASSPVTTTAILTETLDNGVRLLLREDPTTDVVALHTLIGAGTAAESAAQAGLAELTQRLLLRGTQGRTAEEMADQIEGLGAEIGYATYPDLADLYLVVTSDQLADALPIYLDVLTDPALAEDEYLLVQRSQLADAEAARSEPFSVLYDRFRRALYGEGGYANPPLGIPDSVRNLTLTDVRGFHDLYYVPDNMVVSAVGNFDAGVLAARLRTRLGALPVPANPRRLGAPTVELTATTVVTLGAASDLTWLVVGFPVSGAASEDMAAVQVLARVLGERVDRALYNDLYAGAGLPYSLGMQMTPRRGSGDLVVYIVTLPEGAGIVRATVESALADIRRDGVDAAALRRAQNQELGSFLVAHQTADSRARQQGMEAALGTARPFVEDTIGAMRAVTAEDVQRVAELYGQNILIAQLGPER